MGKQKDTEQFIKEAISVHGEKYDYSQTKYRKALEKVCIICHEKDANGVEHGEFWQTPNSHLFGRGCPVCGRIDGGKKSKAIKSGKKIEKFRTKEEIIEAINERYKDKYDTSQAEYVDLKTKIKIICPKHGEFWKTPTNILYNNQGCPLCGIEKRKKTKTKTRDDFIKEATEVHFGFYNYDKVNYERARKNVIITCPIHGDFLQTPDNHLKGCGCPYCQSSRLEDSVRHILENNGIEYVRQYRPLFLKTDKCHSQSLDFFIPKYNVAIECQGIQHFGMYGTFGSKTLNKEEFYNALCLADDTKKKKCEGNGIRIIYYSEINKEYRYPLCHNEAELLYDIMK